MEESAKMRTDREFLSDLRKEIMATQDARLKLTLQKLLFITGLLGIGSSLATNNSVKDSANPVLLAPLIAYIYDFFIEGENFGIRRIGTFIKNLNLAPKSERVWEEILNEKKEGFFIFPSIYKHRDIFASIANPFATLITCAISIYYLLVVLQLGCVFNIWYVGIVGLLFASWLYIKSKIMVTRLDNFKSRSEALNNRI